MTLRIATEADLKSITNLILLCSNQFILPEFTEQGRQLYLSSHTLEKMQERLMQFQYHVIENAGGIVGTVGMQNNSHLFHLHVHPQFHGQGIGKNLWSAAEANVLAQAKPEFITVNSSRFAVPFYKALGFNPNGELHYELNHQGLIHFPLKKVFGSHAT